jgi:hypothetical protein
MKSGQTCPLTLNVNFKKSGRKGFCVFRVCIKPFFRVRMYLRGEIVDIAFKCFYRQYHFGRRSCFAFPQSKMLEDLLYYILILNHAYDFHYPGTFRAGKRINLSIGTLFGYSVNNRNPITEQRPLSHGLYVQANRYILKKI